MQKRCFGFKLDHHLFWISLLKGTGTEIVVMVTLTGLIFCLPRCEGLKLMVACLS